MDLYRVSEGPAFTLHPTIWIDPDFWFVCLSRSFLSAPCMLTLRISQFWPGNASASISARFRAVSIASGRFAPESRTDVDFSAFSAPLRLAFDFSRDLCASGIAALVAFVTAIMNTSTEGKVRNREPPPCCPPCTSGGVVPPLLKAPSSRADVGSFHYLLWQRERNG